MRNSFLTSLYDLAKADKRVLALVADNGAIVFDKFRADLPNQFLNCGIAEATMATVAAGLASCGKIPFTYTITTFLLMRAFEQVRNDICMQNMNVKLVGIGGGLAYSTLGSTHHAIEDIALMKVLANMTILSPCDPMEAGKATLAAAKIKGPVYIRLGTNKEPAIYKNDYSFEVGQAVMLKDGEDLTIIGTGSILNNALDAAQILDREGISTRVVNIHTIKPLDKEMILRCAQETKSVLTLEEHNINGGLGDSVASVILEGGHFPVKFHRMGIQDCFCRSYGPHKYLREKYGLGILDIVREAKLLNEAKSTTLLQ